MGTTTDFVFTTPTGFGPNAFFEQNFFDNGIGATTKVQACFSRAGAVAFLNYCSPPSMNVLVFNSLANVDHTDMQSGDLLLLNDDRRPAISIPWEKQSLQTSGSATESLGNPAESICPRWEENFVSGQCFNANSDTVPGLGSTSPSPSASFFPTWNSPGHLPNEAAERASIYLPKPTAIPPKDADMVDCDFSMLNAGDVVTSACTMDITAYSIDPQVYTPGGAARVFDSRSPAKGCDQLGAPNEDCPIPGPGQGLGGSPLHQPNPTNQNCNDLGNLLIVQKANEEHPFPSETGGCINFSFVAPVVLLGVGVLDIPLGTTVMYTVCVCIVRVAS
jgi:hypothetical protein